MTRLAKALALTASLMASLAAAPAMSQAVDYYDFRQLEKRLEAAQQELNRLSNAVSGGDFLQRFDTLSAEIARLTNDLEKLQFRVRKHEEEAKRKFEDLEYRIIELEGGDPSILFEDESAAPQQEGSLTAPTAPEQPASVGTLGVLTTDAGGQTIAATPPSDEQAAFDAGVNAAQSGRTAEAKNLLEGFVTRYPDSPLAGEAYHWLGESYFSGGDYQSAASRFLDAATLYPASAKAPQSLVRLGTTLSILGQTQVACSTLREVRQRYPGAANAVRDADAEAQRVGCG